MAASQAIQVELPPPAVPPSVESSLPVGERLSLVEMTRIMDVAATLRREQATAAELLNLDQLKARLRAQLLEAARVAGDPVTPEQVDAAIEQYYQRLHEFHEPRIGWRRVVAYLWVLRKSIAVALFGLVAAFLVVWGILSSGAVPGEARNQQTFLSIERNAAVVEKLSAEPGVAEELHSLVASAQAALQQKDSAKLTATAAKIAALQAEIEQQYTLMIPSGPDDRSAIERKWTDDEGTRTSGFFALVKAVDGKGNAVKVPIENRETGKIEMVSTWGEQVPEDVFNRLQKDKQADGVLDEHIFGEKLRGHRSAQVELRGAGGQPLARGGQITSW